MTRTALPAGPMMRVSEPGDIGRVLRAAGRLGHQASLSAAGLRDVADVVRALAISLVLDARGGWISVRELGRGCGPAVEVLAFDRPVADAEPSAPGAWPHLRAQLESLEARAAVRVQHTPGGGTAAWTRISEHSDAGLALLDDTKPDVTGLLQAPPGDLHAGWSAARHGDRLRILVCEAPPGSPSAAAVRELLLTPSHADGDAHGEDLWEVHRQRLDRFCHPLHGGAAALVEVDLVDHTVRAARSGPAAVTVLVDGETTPCEVTTQWERSLSLVAHTAGIDAEGARFDDTAPAALRVATLMREHRSPTATACVVAARIGVAGGPG